MDGLGRVNGMFSWVTISLKAEALLVSARPKLGKKRHGDCGRGMVVLKWQYFNAIVIEPAGAVM